MPYNINYGLKHGLLHPLPDYDMQGYINKYGVPNQSKGQHLTDEFKLPNHITFSNESIYSMPQQEGGRWKKEKGKWHFYPSSFNLMMNSVKDLMSYFNKYESDSILHLPSNNKEIQSQFGINF